MFEALLAMTMMYTNVAEIPAPKAAPVVFEASAERDPDTARPAALDVTQPAGFGPVQLAHIAAAIDAASGRRENAAFDWSAHDAPADRQYAANSSRHDLGLSWDADLVRHWQWFHDHEATRLGSAVPPSLNPRLANF